MRANSLAPWSVRESGTTVNNISLCPSMPNWLLKWWWSNLFGLRELRVSVFDGAGAGADFDNRRNWHAGLLSKNGNFKFRITCYLCDVVSSSFRVVLVIKIRLCLSSGRKYERRHLRVKSRPGLGNFLFSDWSKLAGQSLSVAGCDVAFEYIQAADLGGLRIVLFRSIWETARRMGDSTENQPWLRFGSRARDVSVAKWGF